MMLASILHPSVPRPGPAGVTAYVLLDVLVVVVLARALGSFANRLHQPRAVGEIVAGIALGPTLIGRDLSLFLVPPPARIPLATLATLALVLFMFLVGLEFDGSAVRGREGLATAAGLLSVVIPAALGFLVAAAMHGPRFAGPTGTRSLPFALFIGACLAVTALPVIAHVLLERGELNSPAEAIGLAASAVCSVGVFVYVGLVSTVINGLGYGAFVLRLVLLVVAGIAARFLGRPVLRRLLLTDRERTGELARREMAIVFGGLFLCALVADRLGISVLIGAFVWGLIMPANRRLRYQLTFRLSDVASVLLLPVFFAYAGLSTNLRLLTVTVLPVLALVLAVAIASKFIAALPLRLLGMSWRDAGVVGALMNTRGLVLLVVGLIGLDLHVITQATYTIMVVVALITNVMAGPILDALVTTPEPARSAPIGERAPL
jgi:Kef-type K+ transport system membrane component KefB